MGAGQGLKDIVQGWMKLKREEQVQTMEKSLSLVHDGKCTGSDYYGSRFRKPSLGYKMKEMTGSGIFSEKAGDAMPKSASSIPREMSVRMVQKARELDLKVKKHVPNTKLRELSGHDILDLPPENLPGSRKQLTLCSQRRRKV